MTYFDLTQAQRELCRSLKDYPVERLCRDARLAETGEGAPEIQCQIVAEAVLRTVPDQ